MAAITRSTMNLIPITSWNTKEDKGMFMMHAYTVHTAVGQES